MTPPQQPPFEMPKAPLLIRPLDRLFSKIADNNIRASESSVKDPPRFYRVQRWVLVRYLIVLGTALAVILSTDIPWWGMVGWFAMVYYAAQGASGNATAARKYMTGWLEGRAAMIGSLKEAADRDLELSEWVQGEYERDTMTLMHAYKIEPAHD